MADLTKLVQAIYANFERGDVSSIVETFADDIRFVHSGGPDIPYAKDRHGKQAAAAFFGDLAESVDVSQFEVRKYVEQGDTVMAVGRWAGLARSTGRAFESDWAMLWAFDSSKVKFYQAYENTNAVAKAFAA